MGRRKRDVAKRSGLTERAIRYYRRGARHPRPETLEAITEAIAGILNRRKAPVPDAPATSDNLRATPSSDSVRA